MHVGARRRACAVDPADEPSAGPALAPGVVPKPAPAAPPVASAYPGVGAPKPAAPAPPAPVVHLPDDDPVDDLSEQIAQMSLQRVRARVARAAARPKNNPNPIALALPF